MFHNDKQNSMTLIEMKSMKNNYLEKRSKIPKSIKIYFLILHLLFGQDFGFGNLFKKKTAVFLKYYSAILALTTIIVLGGPFTLIGHKVWYWCTLTECVLNFYVLNTAKYTVYDLLNDIHAAERNAVLEKETFGVVISIYALIMFIAKGFAMVIRCMFDFNLYCESLNHTYLTFYAVCCHAVDLMPEAHIVIRFYIYAYVKKMTLSLKQDRDMNTLIQRYDKIADGQDKIRRLCDYFTLMELFTNVPKFMTSSWFMLDYIKTERKWFTTMGEWVIAFHLAIQIVIPAVIVQLNKYRLDDIRLSLNKWRLAERDPTKNAKIVRVMKYLKGRSLQYKICGIIPTDLRLPLTLISICTTYLIVIIQFTHLYD